VVEENERCIRSHRTVDHVNIKLVSVSSAGNNEGTLKRTDIHLLRQIYNELYDITCLINDTYSFLILDNMCYLLACVVCSLYEALSFIEVRE
jgi:hypothetical protein